jgi:periplasmic protein TonB
VNTASPVFFLDVSTDWYRERPVKVAFVLSLLVHATAIALLPGLRVPSPEAPAPLVVELVAAPPPESPAPVAQPEPQRQPVQPVKRRAPLPLTQPTRPEPTPPTPTQTRPEPVVVAPAPMVREPVPEPAPPVPEVRSETPPPAAPARVTPAPQPAPPEQQATAKAETPTPPPVVVRQVQRPLDTMALKAFGEVLAQAIGKRKDYPRLARARSWQGTTEVTLQIGPDGKLQDVHVGHSSGFPVLDAAAIQMVHNAAPLPEVPEVLRGRELTMTVPVVFRLEAL